ERAPLGSVAGAGAARRGSSRRAPPVEPIGATCAWRRSPEAQDGSHWLNPAVEFARAALDGRRAPPPGTTLVDRRMAMERANFAGSPAAGAASLSVASAPARAPEPPELAGASPASRVTAIEQPTTADAELSRALEQARAALAAMPEPPAAFAALAAVLDQPPRGLQSGRWAAFGVAGAVLRGPAGAPDLRGGVRGASADARAL